MTAPEDDLSVRKRIAAPVDVLYDLVSDITRMGEWSPDNVGGTWLGGATGPKVGARFQGSNRRGWRRWSTSCQIVAADPFSRFAFDVTVVVVPASRWIYEVRPDADGTLVTETWTGRRPSWFGSPESPWDLTTSALTEENMTTTLRNLAEVAERGG